MEVADPATEAAIEARAVCAGRQTGGSDRVHLTWNDGAIRNTWLEVIVNGNDAAGGFNTRTWLAASDVFFWGNKVADSGTSPGASTFKTNSTDAAQAFAKIGFGRPTDLRDYNRDGQVSSTDAAIVFANIGSITRINLGAGGPFAPEASWALASDAASGDGNTAHDRSRGAVASALAIRTEQVSSAKTVPGAVAIQTPPAIAVARAAAEQLAREAAFEPSVYDLDASASEDATFSDELLETLAAASLLG